MDGSLSLRGRSGSRGCPQLFDVEAPLEASFSPNGYGRLKVQVTPVYLYTGQPSNADRALFGTNPITTASSRRTACHQLPADTARRRLPVRALDVSYAYDFVTADIGSSPIGFQQPQIVGGIQFLPRLTNNIYLRLTADRRSVTDSVLSYAGQTDARTGQKWGGVTRNRLYANLEGSVGNTYYYAGAGWADFRGEQVADQPRCRGGSRVQHAGLDDAHAGASARRQRRVFRLPPQPRQLHDRQWRLLQPAAVLRASDPRHLQAADHA